MGWFSRFQTKSKGNASRKRSGSKAGFQRRTEAKLSLEALEERSLLSIAAGPIFYPANGHTYYLLSTSTWTNAESEAVSLGGHLATINGAAENDWIVEMFRRQGQFGLWIGLNDVVSEGNYVWTSGEVAPYRNWNPGQPDNAFGGQEDYVHIITSAAEVGLFPGRWNDHRNLSVYPVTGEVFQGVVEVASSPDIAATSLVWNTAQSGVDFGYRVSGADLTQDTTAALYWASGPNINNIINRSAGPLYATLIERPQDDYGPFYVPNAVLGTPPPGATHLLLVVDPDNLISESDEGNNVQALAVQADLDLEAIQVGINSAGIFLYYDVNGRPLPSSTLASFYWASGDTPADVITLAATSVLIPAGTAVGSHSTGVLAQDLTPAPPSTTHLLAVLDPANIITETNEGNNTAAAPVVLPPTVDLYLVGQDGSERDVQEALRGEQYQVFARIRNNNQFPQTVEIDWAELYTSSPHPAEPQGSGTIGPLTVPPQSEVSVPLGTFQHTWEWLPPTYPFTSHAEAGRDILGSIISEFNPTTQLVDLFLDIAGGIATILQANLVADPTVSILYTTSVRWGGSTAVIQRESLDVEVPSHLQALFWTAVGLDISASIAFEKAVWYVRLGSWRLGVDSFVLGLTLLEKAEISYDLARG